LKADDFWEIIAKDFKGPNYDEVKAQAMRVFHIPKKNIVEHSSSTRPCTVRILAAFVSDKFVIALCDPCALARIHVESRGTQWSANELSVGSQV